MRKSSYRAPGRQVLRHYPAPRAAIRPIAMNFSRRWRRMASRSRPASSAKALAIASPVAAMAAGRIAVGAAGRLRDDSVDDAEAHHVLRGDLHVGRRFLRLGGIAPQDRGGAFGRNDAVDGVLEHQTRLAVAMRDGAAGAAFADDDGDVRHAQSRGTLRSSGRSLRPGRAPRRRCRDRRRRYRPGRSPGWRSGRPSPSAAPPCDSLPAAPCRNCASAGSRYRRPFPGR